MNNQQHLCGRSFLDWTLSQTDQTQFTHRPLTLKQDHKNCEDNFPDQYIMLHSAYLGRVRVPVKRTPNGFLMRTKIFGKIIRCVEFQDQCMTSTYIPPYSILKNLPSMTVNVRRNQMLACTRDHARILLNKLRCETSSLSFVEQHSHLAMQDTKSKFPFLFTTHNTVSYKRIEHVYYWTLAELSKVDIHFVTSQFLQFLKHHAGRPRTIVTKPELISVVGVPQLENAFFNGYACVYGKGGTQFSALSAADVIAHELSHGITHHLNGLEYHGESGALNESFSDIMACCFEHWLYDKFPQIRGCKDWYIGEDICLQSRALRNFVHPETCRQPSTYGGKYFVDPSSKFDYGGVHVNSGVINHFFYRLCEHVPMMQALRDFIEAFATLDRKSTFSDLVMTLQFKYKNHALHRDHFQVCVRCCRLDTQRQ